MTDHLAGASSGEPTEQEGAAVERVTMFMCGPSKCEHDYSGHEPVTDEMGRTVGGTAVCSKCGARAIDEAMWSEF